MPTPSPRNLLPIVVAYLVGAVLSARWNVGASPTGTPSDMFLRGTALTPPLFLPVVLLAGSVAARGDGTTARVGAGAVSLVATAFMAGSTANLPNDFATAESAGTPRRLTAGLAAIHLALNNALPRLRGKATQP